MQTYLKTWEPFHEVWEMNREMFLQRYLEVEIFIIDDSIVEKKNSIKLEINLRYEKLKPTADTFDSDISRYTMIANNVQMQDTMTSVHFLDVNADRLKGAIIEECSVWQQKLIGVLFRQTQTMVNHVYHYIAENSKK